ncbi:YncE family protein [Streptomyces sp. NPDC004065]|uniref:YncE family protein n=1 Tax=Streptomyces sp. NPDC004065 TaxID=3364689 RepID=UPI00384A6418
MLRRTLPAATALAVLVGSVALSLGSAGTAAADTSGSIPINDGGFQDIVVDGVHRHTFISGDNKIVVTDYAGKVVTTLGGLPRVTHMTLSPDSGTLYAAVTDADKIVAVDTATLRQTAEYPTGTGTDPSRVAVAEGRIWFSYGDQWDSGLGAVDLTGDAPAVHLDLAGGFDWSSPPILLTSPKVPGTLVALDGGISNAPIVLYDISSGTPQIRTTAEKGGFYHDAALTPDGTGLVVAKRGDLGLSEYRLTDLTDMRSYPLPEEPESVTIAPDGTVAGAHQDFEDRGETYVFAKGADRPASVRNLQRTLTFDRHTLAWAPDGSRLFAVVDNGERLALTVVTEPRKYTGTLAVTAPASAPRAKALTVSGSLKSTLPLPAGTPLTVTRTDLASPSGKSLGTRKLGAGGKFSFSDTPPAGGKVTYKVSYAGDADHLPASASTAVNVSRATPALTLNHNKSVYAYGTDVSFTAHLGTTYTNRTVELWADPYGGDKPKKLLRTGRVNSHGDLSATVDMTRDTTVTAVFKGDARYAPRTVKVESYARVRIATAVSKHYRTGRIGKTDYHWFHKNTAPTFTTTMTYYKGRKQRFEVEVYYQGKWYDSGSEYFALAANGKSAVRLAAPRESGIRARVRSAYINGTSGDSVNSTTYGPWKYICFTK